VVLVLLVLFVHEAGHFLGMKAFGHKNVQMFFIPLMGAAAKAAIAVFLAVVYALTNVVKAAGNTGGAG